MDISRRRIMQVGVLSALTAFTGTTAAQDVNADTGEFQAVGHYLGTAADRPSPGSEFFDNKDYFAYIYEDENGSKSYLTQDDSAWKPLNYINLSPRERHAIRVLIEHGDVSIAMAAEAFETSEPTIKRIIDYYKDE